MRKKLVFTLITACAAAGVASLAGAAETAETTQAPTEIVSYNPAAAATDSGSAKKLFFRIRGAAAQVCESSSNPVGKERWDVHACERGAVARAVREANAPALNEYYTNVTGRDVK